MDVRFEDHAAFQRVATCLAIGGAAVGAVAALPIAVAGSALALTVGCGTVPWGKRILAASACLAAAVGWTLATHAWWAPLCGAALGLLLATVRADAALQAGMVAPSRLAVVLVTLGAAGAVALGSETLPHVSSALATVVPGWVASGVSAAVLGLWIGLCSAPLHVRVGGDPVETRLGTLRSSLAPELRALAERAVAARRGVAMELPSGARSELRALIDSLTSAALGLAGRAAELARAASPAVGEELRRRCAQLTSEAESAVDPAARQSYLRAADALSAQLEHFGRVRCARERVLARLHEHVVHLERARFSLTLLKGPERAAELDLLHERLQHGVMAFEEADDPAGPPMGPRA